MVLAELFSAAVQVADNRIAISDQLAVELEHHAQHAVRAGVLRTHVEGHQTFATLQRNVFLHGQWTDGLRLGAKNGAGFVWCGELGIGAHLGGSSTRPTRADTADSTFSV